MTAIRVLGPVDMHDGMEGRLNDEFSWPTEFTPGPTYDVLKATRWMRFNASPEPAPMGSTITIRASIERAKWAVFCSRDCVDGIDPDYDAPRWEGYATSVMLQTRTPTGRYTDLKSVRAVETSTGVWAAVRVEATRDACYRFAFSGNRMTGASKSRGDCVKVQ